MNRMHLLVGISVAALSAGVASAQNSQSGNCSPTTTSGTSTTNGNSCTLTRGAGADADNSSINVTGTGNTVSVTQNGIFDTSIVTINGDNNTVTHLQNGNFDFAESGITGNRNTSEITQNGSRMSATVSINGSRNSSTVQQGLTDGVTAAGGSNNTASVTIVGNSIRSLVQQNSGGGTTAGSNFARLNLQTDQAAVAGQFNQSATIIQRQNGNSASVAIFGGSTGTDDLNSVVLTQENTRFQDDGSGGFVNGAPTAANNPSTGNIGDVSVSGQGNSVTVNQDGVRNFSSASVARGGTDTTAAAGFFNGIAFEGGRREGNALTINQDGRNLSALVSIGGRDAAGFNGRGNIATLDQGQGTAATLQPTSNPFQDAIPGNGDETTNTETNAAATASTTNGGRGHSATIFQFGTLSRLTVRQDNNVSNSGTGVNAGGVQRDSIADVSQSGFANTLTLNQLGTNTALISQGGGAADVGSTQSGGNTFEASQVDAGDNANPADSDPFGGSTGFTTQRNTLSASQAGRFNRTTVRQNGTNVSATVFQRRGSSSATIELNQGAATGFGISPTGGTTTGTTAGAAGNMTANIDQGGAANSTGSRPVLVQVRQDGNNLTANVSQNATEFSTASGTTVGISQVGNRNSTTVTQTGSNAIATVDQRGTNTVAGSTLTNNVRVTQQGGSFSSSAGNFGNRAVVRQFESAGVSSSTGGGTTATTGEGTGTRSGSQSAEAVIFQSVEGGTTDAPAGSNNSATIEQNALGVYAEIDQRGRNNLAGIRQNNGATNSVAIIRQTGNMNTFFVTQDSPNQFFRVVQTGGGNQTVTGTGTNGGQTSTATFTPTAAPTAPGSF